MSTINFQPLNNENSVNSTSNANGSKSYTVEQLRLGKILADAFINKAKSIIKNQKLGVANGL